jgi:hypothetical protein
MNQWSFVIAAYLVVAVATIAVVGWAYGAMRRAEGRDE